MKVLKPAIIDESRLASSTAPVAFGDEQEWDDATPYKVGDECYVSATRRRYRAAIDNTNRSPVVDTSPDKDPAIPAAWADIGPMNQWAMFDDVVGTATVGEAPLTVAMRPGSTTGIALMEVQGRAVSVVMKDLPTGVHVYERTVDLDGTIVESFYDWFFEEFDMLTDVVLTDLPGQFASCELTVTVQATTEAAIGVCKPGVTTEIGDARHGARVGITDFSSKTTNRFGQTAVVERAYSKRASLSLVTEKHRFNKIFRTLASLRATPCVYIGTEKPGYEPLFIYGFFRDFSIDVAYSEHHLCSIEVEGLI